MRLGTAFCVLLNYFCFPAYAGENTEDVLPSFETSALSKQNKQEEFKLFDSSSYEFLEPKTPLFLPPEQKEQEKSSEEDTYYQYSRAYLEKAIKDMKGGIELQQRGLEYMEILNPSLLLPIFGTTISMTGRKTFGLNYSARKYKTHSTVGSLDQSGLSFVQEMQLKVQGKVNDRIFVDVDYDDQREDEQNISLSYRGKGKELVQSVDFGDIQATLPGTEFLSYNKRVFGAKMHLQHGGANLHLVGSQNKGEKKSKQFKGNSVFETVQIKDIGYIRRTYYDLTFGCNSSSTFCDPAWKSAIVPASEKVYLDNHTNNGYLEAISARDLNIPSTTYPTDGGTAAFKLLTRGVDYTIDYNRNILIFSYQLKDTDVVAINYQNIDGAWVAGSPTANPIIVKTPSDRYLINPAEDGWQLEIKRYYNIGAKQIAQDNGQGNFILKLLESDGKETCAADDPRLFCKYTVDYDKGIFELLGRFNEASAYNPTPVSAANRYFFVQYNSTTRTYFLDSNIVVQSETIKVNGATMARNKDYYVDYASGYLTFYNENLIGSSSVIDATYSIANDTSAQDTTLLGARFNYDFTDNISIGASILNEGGNKPSQVPNIGDMATSLTTTEADFKIKDLELTEGLEVSLGVEAAQSRKEENLFGYAMVDSMDQSKESVEASVVFNDWKIASNPSNRQNFLDAIHWDSQEIKTLEINPKAAATAKDTQNVLVIDYDFSLAKDYGIADNENELSLVFPISNYGADFTNKTLLELSMLGVENGPFINISFGTMSEKSDNYDFIPPDLSVGDIFPLCSKYYVAGMASVPKTEDMRCTGELTPSEDVGWIYVNPDGSWQRYDPFKNNKYNPAPQPNGVIDTQDLNDTGILDSYDASAGGNFGYNGEALITDPAQTGLEGDIINFSGWKIFQREISLTDQTRWGNIKQMRITLKRNPAGAERGTIKIARLAVSGNTWQEINSSANEALLPYGINNIDNPSYKPIFNDTGDGGKVFKELYGSISNIRSAGSNNVREQALALQYDFTKAGGADNIFVQRNFTTMDFSQHKQFNFLLYNDGAATSDTYFYLQIASDDTTYSQVKVPLDFTKEWRLYTLKMIDTNGDGTPNRWEADCPYLTPADITNTTNILNYKRVGIIKAGFISTDPTAQGTVWLNDIFLGDAVVRKGEAYSAHAKINLDNWFETGAKVRYMDEDFQTPVSVPQDQENTTQDYFFKFKRFKKVPISATYSRSDITTPNVLDYTSSNNVSLLDQGKVKRDNGTINAEYISPGLPRIGIGYAFANTDYKKMQRNDDTKTYSVNMNWTPVKQKKIKNITASASLNKIGIDYANERLIEAPSTYYNTKETSQNYSAKIAFEPFKGSSIVPSYSLTTADEKRRYFDASTFKERKYDKYATENVSLSTTWRLNRWLAPSASYNINIKENNNLSPTSYSVKNIVYDFDIGEVKTLNRTSAGAITLGLNGRDLFPKNKLLANLSLSASYRMQDGDSWYYVDNSFNSLDKLWLRSSLGLNAPYSYRNNMTLRDTYSLTTRWLPFKDYKQFETSKLKPLQSLSLISNASLSYQTTEYLGSAYETKTTNLPDLIIYLDQVENFWTQDPGFLSGINLKLKYNLATNNVQLSEDKKEASYGTDLRFILFKFFDTNLNYTHQTLRRDDTLVNKFLEDYVRDDFSAQTSFNYKNFRFTPKITYLYDRRTQVDKILADEVKEIVPSLNIKADFNMPKALSLPFASKNYLATNRVIWNTNISYSRRRSYTVSENRNLLNINTNFDYELSKNIRFTISGSYEIFKHLYIDTQSYNAYSFGSLLTVQF